MQYVSVRNSEAWGMCALSGFDRFGQTYQRTQW